MGGRGEAERNADEEKTGGVLKSVFVEKLLSEQNVRKRRSGCDEDVFSKSGWLRLRGSRAAKTKKSGNMLKTEISRWQLAFGSDDPPADLNA